ncbi:outer membrane beta-barrel protein [Trinickia sp. LjRoot230]|uniref:OmpW/AlkL family protein n=1 Tax=Trinickia sp. LjRoot230 TaxID=3342288 RepID=UPI003ECF97E7
MKLQQAITGTVAALACATAAHAQTAGTFYLSTGWFHFSPQSSSDPLKVISIGGTPVNQPVAGTGASVDNSDTIGISAGYFITDHLAAELEGGVPPKFNLNGAGSFTPYGKLGSARLWSPALLVKWHFMKPDDKFRPYVGIGVTRVWFSDAQITNNAFQSGVLHGGPTSVSTDRSWSPVFNAGFNYAFNKHWFAGVSVSYIPVSVTADLTTSNVGPFGLTAHTQAKIKLNPIVTFAKIGYAF